MVAVLMSHAQDNVTGTITRFSLKWSGGCVSRKPRLPDAAVEFELNGRCRAGSTAGMRERPVIKAAARSPYLTTQAAYSLATFFLIYIE
uniref:Uncharacterized protein n=1 Tax=Arctia plantaginis TaxID=874455 RepID=A0A8S0YTC5_ARCPL|nr:unnamed protein product [Arctia plantaginis]